MTSQDIEKYKYSTVELHYTIWVNAPGIVIEDGIETEKIVKKKVLNKRVGIITNTTAKKIVFLIDDEDDDIEIYVPYENIVKVRKIKEYEAL